MLQDYYDRRAREYEHIYHRDDLVRQSEQAALAADLRESLCGRSVLDVACGTGYLLSPVATDLQIHVGKYFWWLRYTL